jgi:hypothetical protein
MEIPSSGNPLRGTGCSPLKENTGEDLLTFALAFALAFAAKMEGGSGHTSKIANLSLTERSTPRKWEMLHHMPAKQVASWLRLGPTSTIWPMSTWKSLATLHKDSVAHQQRR